MSEGHPSPWHGCWVSPKGELLMSLRPTTSPDSDLPAVGDRPHGRAHLILKKKEDKGSSPQQFRQPNQNGQTTHGALCHPPSCFGKNQVGGQGPEPDPAPQRLRVSRVQGWNKQVNASPMCLQAIPQGICTQAAGRFRLSGIFSGLGNKPNQAAALPRPVTP